MNLARAAPGLSCRPHRRRPRDDVMANSFFPFSPISFFVHVDRMNASPAMLDTAGGRGLSWFRGR